MQLQHCLSARAPHREGRRPAGARRGVITAVVAAALCAWVVLVQHGNPEFDASIARQSLALVDGLLAADAGDR